MKKYSLLLLVLMFSLFIQCTRVFDVDVPPETFQVRITASASQGHALLKVAFSAQLDGGSPPFRYEWDFDQQNGVQVDQINPTPEFIYAEPGYYFVTLTVRDRLEAVGQDTIAINVLPAHYESAAAIDLINVHGTAEAPIIIRGKEITAAAGNGIRLINCSHIVLQDNYIHHVSDADGMSNSNNGNAIVVQTCHHIVVERNRIVDNQKGIYVFSPYGDQPCSNIRVSHNLVRNSAIDHSIAMHWIRDVEVNGNYMINNGDPAHFLLHRLSGIQIWDFVNLCVHDNISIASSSDGIALYRSPGYPDKAFLNENLVVYNNTVRENSEQGMYLTGIRKGKVYNNYFENNTNPDPALGSSGLCLSWNVSQFEIYNNAFVGNEISAIMVNQSQDNLIFQNVIRESKAAVAGLCVIEEDLGDAHYPVRSERNRVCNNLFAGCSRALWIDTGRQCEINNNVVFANGPFNTGTAGIEIGARAEGTVLCNNIFMQNHGYGVSNASPAATMSYNCFWQNHGTDFKGLVSREGQILVDPCFIDAARLNFQLKTGSPCVNAGDPNSPYNDADGSRNDMGAFGGPLGQWQPLKLKKR